MKAYVHKCLPSSLGRPAKEDAMSALVACCVGYGREAMLPHLDKVRGQSAVSSLPSV